MSARRLMNGMMGKLQFLLFVNGEAIQGIDMNHRDVLLQKKQLQDRKMTLELCGLQAEFCIRGIQPDCLFTGS